jgi:hypothetical protein
MSEYSGKKESVRKIRAQIPALTRGAEIWVYLPLSPVPSSELFGCWRLWPGSPRPIISALCQHAPTQRGTETLAVLSL